ncbi:hypothetical protein [Psychrobacter sp. AOP31-A1-22]|uniref:hypothetical protein n=1 Tax=Psychrobacter sp. AOP31-A1-22 TaxID=3457696 RepID=UPI0040361DF5
MKGTIIIKCIACEGNIELPTQNKRCCHCDAPLKKSKKTAYKTFKVCFKEMRSVKASNERRCKAIQRAAEKEAAEITEEATAELKLLMKKDMPNSEFLKFSQATEKKIITVFDEAHKQIDKLNEDTMSELAELASKAGYHESNREVQEGVQKASPDELKKEGSPYELKWLTIIMCMLIVSVGISITQTYPFLGVVTIVAGLLMLPLTHEFITKTFTWLSYANMRLMGYALLTGVMLKIAMIN